MAMTKQDKLKEYDLEPVEYCSNCYSLKIKYEEVTDSEYCMDCGCSDILSTSIEEWEKLYEKKYGHKLVEKGIDVKNTPIFKMPLNKLKMKVYDHPQWRSIIRDLYKKFPDNLGRADSVILLFDRLSKDNRLDDLRLLLLNKYC
jgi:ferredoxin-like protein FixX